MESFKQFRRASVVYLLRDDRVCLGIKTKHVGAGLWNGYGGVIEEHETPREGAVREVKEECGVEIHMHDLDLVARALVKRTPPGSTEPSAQSVVYFYTTRVFRGHPVNTSEMRYPTWFQRDRLPLDRMMLGDREFIPMALCGAKISARVVYGPGEQTLLEPVAWSEVGEWEDNT